MKTEKIHRGKMLVEEDNENAHRIIPIPGVFVIRKTKTPILTCKCGNKYLQTRKNQRSCVRCMFYPQEGVKLKK